MHIVIIYTYVFTVLTRCGGSARLSVNCFCMKRNETKDEIVNSIVGKLLERYQKRMRTFSIRIDLFGPWYRMIITSRK